MTEGIKVSIKLIFVLTCFSNIKFFESGVRNDNGGRFRISAGPTIWLLADQHASTVISVLAAPSGRYANQIDHLAISRRFRGCLEDIRNRKVADIGNLRDHYLIDAMLRLRTASI